MTKRIFIWLAHPAETSFCGGLADAYERGAASAGATISRMNLSDMQFSDRFAGYPATDPLEPDLTAWQRAVGACDHMVVIHPYWWGAMPGRAKAVLDRALLPGFAFKYKGRGPGWDKLLTGKTADAIITSDTPPLYDRLVYGQSGRKVLKNQVFSFCGFTPKTIAQMGPIKTSSEKKRARWLKKAERMGLDAAAS